MTRICLLSADPGTANYGYCILSASIVEGTKPTDLRILQFGKINTTIKSMVGRIKPVVEGYSSILEYIMRKHEPVGFIAERFQTRGIGGPTIEIVSFMLGITAYKFIAEDKPVKLIIASQWKVAFNKKAGDLVAFYEEVKSLGISPHEVDAFCIGVYGLCLYSGIKPFEGVEMEYLLRILLKYKESQLMLGDVSVSKKVRKKRRK
jgi:Holliday junction resolvasome RuvABC endonuclease subunit